MNPLILLLLVEDEALIRLTVEDTFSDEGFELVSAKNGAEAVAELDADATRFRAVVTDIRLGGEPDGWGVARHARALVPAIPVVYISGDSAHNWPTQGVPDSVMVSKPFTMDQLLTAVTTLLSHPVRP